MPVVPAPAFDAVYGIKEADICNIALSKIGCELILNTLEDTQQARVCRAVYAVARDDLLRVFPFSFSTRTASIIEDALYSVPNESYGHAYKAENLQAFNGNCSVANGAVIDGIYGIDIDDSLIDLEVVGQFIPSGARVLSVDSLSMITLDRPATGTGTDFFIRIPLIKVLNIDDDKSQIFEVIGSGPSKRVLSSHFSGTNGNGDALLNIRYTHCVLNPDHFDPLFTDTLASMIASKIALSLTKSMPIKQSADQDFSAMFNAAKIASSEERNIDEASGWWTDRLPIGSDIYPGRG